MTNQNEVEMPEKAYLGDGVYASLDRANMIQLTTENGIDTTNEIMDSENQSTST